MDVIDRISATDIANEISMMRSSFSGSFLVVEGTTDSRLYGKFIDKNDCKIIPAHSKDNVRISVRESYLRRNDKKVLGIVDPDTDTLKGIDHRPPVFITDCRDSETMMIRSSAFDNVMSEYGDDEKTDHFVRRYGKIKDVIVDACYPLGLLMYVSDVNEYDLSFKDPDHRSFIERKGLRTDIDSMLSHILSNSPHSDADEDEVKEELKKEMKNDHDPWDVCRGHDMISVLSIGLREVFGGYNSRTIRTGELAGALRLAYDKETFGGSGLYADTSTWCSANSIKVWSF